MYSDEILPRNNLASAINILRDLNLNHQERFSHCRDMFAPVQFAQELQTVRVGSGRQTGKSTYIAEMARPQDFVIAYNGACAKYLKQNLRCDGLVMTASLALSGKFPPYLSRWTSSGAHFDVYIDDASHIPDAKMKQLYEVLSYYNVSQYILLG